MAHEKFDISKIARLDDEGRLTELDPELMWDALGRPSPEVIVDVGAGTGLFARRFASLAPAATVFAVDTEPAMIRWMDEHEDPAIGSRLVPVLAEETHVPLPDAAADLVVMINLHHELASPRDSYAEAFRLLRSEGQLLVADWALGDTVGGPPQEIRATSAQIADMLRGVGFERVTHHEGLPRHTLVTAYKG
ncbi:MAG TPA: class I SAM-dependent methyltransferase [Coriobacteriia bacterium]